MGGKGGTGKTTLTSNLASALVELGQDVIAVDANMTTPHLGLQTGLHLTKNSLHHVLKGQAKLKDAIYPHPLGFKVIPGSLNMNDLEGVDIGKLPEVTMNLVGKTDYVLIDSAPTLGREATSAIGAVEEVLLVANPDLPSVTDALKTAKIAEKLNKKIIGVVVNRVKKKRHELRRSEIEEILEYPVIAEVPEDRWVHASGVVKHPVVGMSSESLAADEFRRVAHFLVGKQFQSPQTRLTILDRMVGWLTG